METAIHKSPVIFSYNSFINLDLEHCKETYDSGAYPLVKIPVGTSMESLTNFAREAHINFGGIFDPKFIFSEKLPQNLEYVVVPFTKANILVPGKKLIYIINSLEESLEAKDRGAYGIIVKGNEAAGLVGEDSSFVLFQKVIKVVKIPVWVQGGVGIHTAASLISLGATGVVLDDQLTFFAESRVPVELKSLLKNLDGTETKVIYSRRVFMRPGAVKVEEITEADFLRMYERYDGVTTIFPISQDIGNAVYYFNKYKKLKYFIFAIKEAIAGHLKQAQYYQPLQAGNSLCAELGIQYPIAQGPMTRVSDVPEFSQAVTTGGGLSFLALALMNAKDCETALHATRDLLKGNTWGVGILGFISPEILQPQVELIKGIKPPVVLIAGGRPAQAKPLEKLGIKVFLHVPSAGLLDSFLKDGARKFVFEGRECGGHVGPLSSFVLWEKQINRLMQEENLHDVFVLFAGGIHDALSSAMISVMAAPLAARGAKIGVLMGSSYLFTNEAVETGAILKEFQESVLQGNETKLLESSSGHVVRCLPSPFVDFFDKQKKELLKKMQDRKEIGQQLELLNVGRLRIATKGLERQGATLVHVGKEQQLEHGLYMVGQVVTMRSKVISIRELHEEVSTSGNELLKKLSPAIIGKTEKHSNEDIAVIGMACIFPDAKNMDVFWNNILQGKDSVTEVSKDRWSKETYYDAKASHGNKSTSKWGGFIPEIDFDPLEFGIPPQSLSAIEPVQLLSLKVAKEALKDAGYEKKVFDRENTAVIFGVESGSELAFGYDLRAYFPHYFGELPAEVDQVLPKLTEDSFPGVLSNVVTGRIANRLDLGGKNYTVDAACGSSLAAIDAACQELVTGRAEMVIAGAADLHNSITDYLKFSSAQALTSQGKCKTFDEVADGISLGEGIAVVILKRLADARADGDRIYSIIKSVGASSDGKSMGLTAPNKKGQLRAFERAYQQAGVSASELGMIEAHGTGTVVGDKTELSSMTELLAQSGALPARIQLGSVKTQIGHTKCAAGLAGLIKASLALYYGVRPPTLHLNKPNAYYNPAFSPFQFYDKAVPWLDKKRIAGLSAFGFGGTNFHSVLQNAENIESEVASNAAWPAELFVLRASDAVELKMVAGQIVKLIAIAPDISLKNISYSLSGLNEKEIQVCFVASNHSELVEKLQAIIDDKKIKGVYTSKPVAGKLAFLFSGQGSQRVDMARDLFVTFPEMRHLLLTNPALEKIIFPPKAFDEYTLTNQKNAITDTRNAQPLLGIVDYAIARFLVDLGVQPDMLAGHSYGELPALCLAGVINEADLVDISGQRAESILEAAGSDPGAMVAVSGSEDEIVKLLEEEEIYVSNKNSATQWVISGSTDAMRKFCIRLKSLNISFRKLEVACAFHSPVISGSEAIFKAVLDTFPLQSPKIAVWSNTTAYLYPDDPEEIRERLSKHLVKPVVFFDQIQNMYQDGARIFIETGPGDVLTKLTGSILGEKITALNTESKSGEGVAKLLDTLAQYIASGRSIKLEKLFEGRGAVNIELQSPEKYAISSTTWKVNGGAAFPIKGKLPVHAAVQIKAPIKIMKNVNQQYNMNTISEADAVVLKYLENMQTMVRSQHEVLLGYFGTPPAPQSLSQTRTISKQFIASHEVLSEETPSAVVSVVNQLEQITPAAIKKIDVKNILLETVSEKTGYPVEMLDLTMDMEADLSIDSIKRVEIIQLLKTRLGGISTLDSNEDIVQKLSSLKTLQAIIEWLEQRTTSVSNLPVLKTPIPFEKPQKKVAEKYTVESISSVLLETISEKTGYPQDMLDKQMDMEADLSIDSIKRVEIINKIRSRISIPSRTDSGEDDIVEKLAAIKTVQGLIDWIFNQVGEAVIIANEISVKKTALTMQDQSEEEDLFRFTIQQIPSDPEMLSPEILYGKNVAIAGDGIAAQTLKQLLKHHHVSASIVDEYESLEEFDGLIVFDLAGSTPKTDIRKFFSLVQKLNPERVRWIYAVTDIHSELQKNPSFDFVRKIQGYPGFLNSLEKEWKAICRTIHLEDSTDPTVFSGIVINELLIDDHSTESFHRNGNRFTSEFSNEDLNTGKTLLKLGKDNIVLVLGGAQGITSEILKTLSLEMPATYILVGRSPSPDGLEDGITEKDAGKIRQLLVKNEKFASPLLLEQKVQKIYKRNQILETLETLEHHGSDAYYYSLDVCAENDFVKFIEFLYEKYGRIDGVIHASGYLDDKHFHKKTTASFEKVFSTKVIPLEVLSKHLRRDVKFLVLFSSIASVMGNKGQVDYAAANSVLDQAAEFMSHRIDGRVITINWGPWKGKGMISEALEKDLLKRGISSIPIAAGVRAFIQELKYGQQNQVILMTKVEELIEA